MPLPSKSLGYLCGVVIVFACSNGKAVAASQPIMRVLVQEARQLRIRADAQKPLLVDGLGRRSQRVGAFSLRQRNGGYQFKIDQKLDKWVSVDPKQQIIVRSRDPRGIWLGKRRYRGELRVYLISGKLLVVNYLGLQDYLQSVVGSEMPKTWPMEALKAQAVAARTYALKNYGKKSFYDIKSNQSSQVYLGVEAETIMTNKAVAKTRSLVITHKGQLINSVFHSSSGGLTEASGDVWKYQLPYLVSVPDFDQHGSVHQWNKSFSPKELKKSFSNIGAIKNIELLNISPTGRVLNVKVKGSTGELSLTGKELRKILDLKSTLVRFKMISKNSSKKSLFSYYPASSVFIFEDESPTLTMRKSKGFWRDWDKGGESIINTNLPVISSPPKLNILKKLDNINRINDLPPLPEKDQNIFLLVRGYGAGHGVGMSQWGANGLARKGLSYRKIINHFYKDVRIQSYHNIL